MAALVRWVVCRTRSLLEWLTIVKTQKWYSSGDGLDRKTHGWLHLEINTDRPSAGLHPAYVLRSLSWSTFYGLQSLEKWRMDSLYICMDCWLMTHVEQRRRELIQSFACDMTEKGKSTAETPLSCEKSIFWTPSVASVEQIILRCATERLNAISRARIVLEGKQTDRKSRQANHLLKSVTRLPLSSRYLSWTDSE